jgi:hypothetical protein
VVDVGCQLGHVARTTGATGTGGCCGVTEQQYVQRLFDALEPKLRAAGHTPIKILADPPSYPAMDLFFAFHCDGSVNSSARGCTFGFRDDLANATASKGFGDLWRAAHNAVGYPGGNRPTNSTTNLSRYYALKPATQAGADRAIVIEFGFLTNRDDHEWLNANVDRVADALVKTVVAFHGGAFVLSLEDDMTKDDLLDALESERGQTILGAAVRAAVRHELRVATGPDDATVPAGKWFDGVRADVTAIRNKVV